MSFDPELFGQAMGAAIQKAVEPLKSQIEALRDDLEKANAECSRLRDEIAALPTPEAGKSFTLEDAQPVIDEAVALIVEEVESNLAAAVEKAVAEIPKPKDGKDGADGKDGKDGEKGADGAGIADLMIDRAGELVATFTDGRMKNLGPVIGRDGEPGRDGKDGVSLESFEMEYLPDTHEVRLTAQAGDVKKTITYPAGGIHGKGYWRDGQEAKAGEAWVQGGSLWIAKRNTTEAPSHSSENWFMAARKGRDGESVVRRVQAGPAQPIRLKEDVDESGDD